MDKDTKSINDAGGEAKWQSEIGRTAVVTSSSRPVAIFGSISTLLFGTVTLILAQGLFLLLVPLKLAEMGSTATAISTVVSAYFAGFVVGAWYCDRIIRTVGHIRSFGGLVAIVIAAALTLPLFPDALAWAIIRFIHGAAVSGVFLTIESWLNAMSPNQWRGRLLATYTVLSLAALGSGQLLVNLYGASGSDAFNLGAILLALSIVPIVLSRTVGPKMERVIKRSQLDLYRHSPLGTITSFAGGLNTGAFWALAPLFATAVGLEGAEVTMLMAITVFGGLILMWPFGYLSDRFDRRRVILAVACIGTFSSAAIMITDNSSRSLLLSLIFIFGGVSFSLYPLSIAHVADHLAEDEDMLDVSRGLLLSNGLGLAIGPLAGGQVYQLVGRNGLFVFATAIIGSVAILSLWRMTRRSSTPLAEQGAYVLVHESTPAALALDPRTEEAQQELDLVPK